MVSFKLNSVQFLVANRSGFIGYAFSRFSSCTAFPAIGAKGPAI